MKEAKEWVQMNSSQPDLVFGNTQYSYCYLSDHYRGMVDWNIDDMLIVTIDIEVQCENGFPSPKLAEEEMLSLTIKNHQSKKIVVWGIGEFKTDREDVTYIQCESEVHLLKEFLVFWERHQPDVVTGWNSEFFDIPYLCNRIKKLFGEDELKRLEKRLDELVQICKKLQTENQSLKQRQDSIAEERANLIQKNEQVRARVEAMIGRLKAMEQGS